MRKPAGCLQGGDYIDRHETVAVSVAVGIMAAKLGFRLAGYRGGGFDADILDPRFDVLLQILRNGQGNPPNTADL
jgi:hypothetical protein